MNFTEAVAQCFKKYATFDGTARRSEYWWFVLFNFIVSVVLILISEPLSWLYSAATFLPGLAVTCRRLHDTDRSGWWFFISFVPLIGAIIMLVFMVQDSRPNRYGAPANGAIA